MPINSAHRRYLELLLSHAASERFPSHQVLARIEDAITDRQTAEIYADVLFSVAEDQRYPSLRMVDRAGAAVTKMAIADKLAELMERDSADDD